jgi:penicillin-binding protein 1A
MGVYSPIDPVPSMFLGTSDITLYEMVGAYGTFANKGVYTQPIFVTRIEDRHGNCAGAIQAKSTIDRRTNRLSDGKPNAGVIDEGSGGRLRWHQTTRVQRPIAGKKSTPEPFRWLVYRIYPATV